ncbi:MAG: HEAT repeat domain-containing protein [Elusimicrobia bacterium]|nr:HEAT repeat domain-containing protein [Elusimicrobiota bacterium]
MRPILFAALLFASAPGFAQVSAPFAGASSTGVAVSTGGLRAGPSMAYDPQIVTTLLDLLAAKDRTRPSSDDFVKSSLKDLIILGTPEGFHLRNRYLYLGMSLSEALSYTDDPRLKDQLIELARWERNHEIRALALIALSTRREPQHLPIFREALINIDPEIRFAGLEALETWNLPGAKEEFARAIKQDRTSIIRVYAGQALARRGDVEGLETLRRELVSGDWLSRAMAAKYLGDLGTGADYDRMLERIGSEQTNDFVLAESAIAALKLFPKKTAEDNGTPAPPPPTQIEPPPPVGGGPAAGLFAELDPLVITAPRLGIPATLLIDNRVNAALTNLLDNKANARPKPEDLTDPAVIALNSLSSPMGFKLKTRYTELGFLLTEGLAGTADLILRDRIIRVAQQGTNPQVRASALVAVAYNKGPGDRGIFQEALLSQDLTVRFGAMEALIIWDRADALNDIGTVARIDQSLPAQVYAAGILLRNGNGMGRDMLIRLADNQDWLARAMSYRYLGELGVADDYDRIMFNMSSEKNLFVQSEMCGALLRLFARGAKRDR